MPRSISVRIREACESMANLALMLASLFLSSSTFCCELRIAMDAATATMTARASAPTRIYPLLFFKG